MSSAILSQVKCRSALASCPTDCFSQLIIVQQQQKRLRQLGGIVFLRQNTSAQRRQSGKSAG
jgi:hypothetical protein